MSFLAELNRRNVVRVAAGYVLMAWLIVQVVETVFPAFGFGNSAVRTVVIVLAIGLVPVIVFAWAFEITPEGLKLEKDVDPGQSITPHTGKKLNRIIMFALAMALVYFAFDKFVLSESRQDALVEMGRQEARVEALVGSYGDKSIAVLPFINISGDEEQEYFADGISEELINLLAKVSDLRVISRSSVFSYKGKDIKLSEVARELSVAHILEGSVRKAGKQVRITAQLIEARSDTHVWSDTFDRPMDDIFAIQDEIAAKVVEQLKVTLLGPVPTVEETDPAAYSLLLQAGYVSRQGTQDGYTQSNALTEQALAIDPDYKRALVNLAINYVNEVNRGLRYRDEGISLAREMLQNVVAIDPEYARAHTVLGWIALNYDHDLTESARRYERALASAPRDLRIIGTAASQLGALGRLDEAIALKEFVVARDPVNAVTHANLGFNYGLAGRWDESIDSMLAALRLSPGYIGAYHLICKALLLKGNAQEAMEAIQQEPSERHRLIGLAMAHHALGQSAESDAALAEAMRKFEKTEAYNIAYALAFRGEADHTFEWLMKAVEYGDAGLVEIVAEPLFAPLHDDSRWMPFLDSIGKSPAQLAAIEFNVTIPE